MGTSPGVTQPGIPSAGAFGYPATADGPTYDPSTHSGTYAPLRLTIPADQTDNYTATSADANASTGINNAAAKTVTINTGVFAAGDVAEYRQVGGGQVTIAAGAGVTLRSPAGLKTRAQYSAVQVLCLGSEVFSVSGDTTA